jgi:hypothetical protein
MLKSKTLLAMRTSQKLSQISISPLSPKPDKQICPLCVHIHSLTAWNITGGHAASDVHEAMMDKIKIG